MVEIKDEEDGRVALIMDKEELPLAVGALMRAGYELTPPSDAEAEEPEEPEEAEEPEAEAEEPEAEAEEPEEPEEEDEEYERRGPVRRRGSRARR